MIFVLKPSNWKQSQNQNWWRENPMVGSSDKVELESNFGHIMR